MKARILITLLASLTLAACATGPRYGSDRYGYGYEEGRYARCNDCGRVDRIVRIEGRGEGTGAGAVLGGIVGGVLGSQVGSGTGRDVATAAGAVGGAVAGHRIEERARDRMYELYIRMDDGRRIIVQQNELNGIREGSYVRVRGDSARLL